MDGEGVGIDVEEAILEVSFNLLLESELISGEWWRWGWWYHGLLSHLWWTTGMSTRASLWLTGGWWEGPISPISPFGSKRCRRAEPSIPLQSIPQVRPIPLIPHNAKLISSDRFISPLTLKSVPASHLPTPIKGDTDEAPEGTVKSILPCTPLAIVKVLEHLGVYNKMLNYGDRARGKVITVINRYIHPFLVEMELMIDLKLLDDL